MPELLVCVLALENFALKDVSLEDLLDLPGILPELPGCY